MGWWTVNSVPRGVYVPYIHNQEILRRLPTRLKKRRRMKCRIERLALAVARLVYHEGNDSGV